MQAVFNRSLSRSLSRSANERLFTDECHSNNLLKGLAELRRSNTFCDISLQVNEHQIQAHKLVLSAFCPYFAAMFRPHTKEGSQEIVTLPDFLPGSTLDMLVDFAYTGQLVITGDAVQDLLLAANFLSIESVQKACCTFLADNMDVGNCLNILAFADQLGCTELASETKNFISFHFADVIKADEFLDFPCDRVTSILQMEDTCIEHPVGVVGTSDVQEQVIYEALIRYVEYAPEERLPLLADWLQYVHLPLMTDTALDQIEEDLLQKGRDRKCLVLVQKAKEKKAQMAAGPGPVEEKWCQPRCCTRNVIVQAKGFANHGYVLPDLESFRDEFKERGLQCHVTGMKLWIRRWDGRPVLGGLSVHFSNGTECIHGQTDCPDVHEFHLDPDERINQISVNCGYLIDKLTFHTTKNRQFGPYGGPGGGEGSTCPPPGGKCGHLVGVSGSVVNSQDSLALTRLKFIWMSYIQDVNEVPKQKPKGRKYFYDSDTSEEYTPYYGNDIDSEYETDSN